MGQDDAIARLARQIDAARKSERLLMDPDALTELRRRGASELHRICADFVQAVNSRLPEPLLDLSPPSYSPDAFRQPGTNLIQIASQGRAIQIAFEATAQPVSTEKFLVPHVLEGEVRAYNQQMLQRFEVRSRAIFFCVEEGSSEWRFFEWRTLHTGPFGREVLTSLMEPLF